MGWQKASGYNARARAEAAVARYKQVIGDGLRSRKDERRATEVEVAIHALNRILAFGRPISVRIASPRMGLGRVRPHFGSVQHGSLRRSILGRPPRLSDLPAVSLSRTWIRGSHDRRA
jgi:hypothetical protein